MELIILYEGRFILNNILKIIYIFACLTSTNTWGYVKWFPSGFNGSSQASAGSSTSINQKPESLSPNSGPR